jgi:hypothetical protein
MCTQNNSKGLSQNSFLKKMIFGEDFRISSPADVMYVLDEWKEEITAKKFKPLIYLTGGISLVDDSGKELVAMIVCNDWINICHKVGATVKGSCTCLAFNFDEHQGLVALAMEIASVSLKEKSFHRMTKTEFLEFIEDVFVRNVGNIAEMATTWGVEIKPEGDSTPAKSRTFWKEKLGHDVLIHPITLEPCTDEFGKFLHFEGIVTEKSTETESEQCMFKFTTEDGKEFLTKHFPKTSVS